MTGYWSFEVQAPTIKTDQTRKNEGREHKILKHLRLLLSLSLESRFSQDSLIRAQAIERNIMSRHHTFKWALRGSPASSDSHDRLQMAILANHIVAIVNTSAKSPAIASGIK